MGLCKCPKRKTTSHFCFHHCVNVCEHCIVNSHTTCVVKSYTTWLKESSNSISSSVSASSVCAVCQKQFVSTLKEIDHLSTNDSNSSINTAIRLLCYHLVHARCLSVYVKKQLKNDDILKCPSCARLLWTSQQNLDDISEVNINELSPVGLQLYNHLLTCNTWWSKIIITNEKIKDIEKHFLEEDDYDVESLQLFENESTPEIKPQLIIVPDNIQPTLSETFSTQNDKHCYYRPEITNTKPYQPIHHRIFNNNYGIDSVQENHSLSVNMAIVQNSDVSNRHVLSATTPLLLNNDNLNYDAGQQDPSGKYRIKKFNNQYWSLSFQRLLQYLFYGTNNRTENNTTRIIIIIVCILIISILLFAITSYTRSNNEPFENNSIDYGGDMDREN